MEYCSAAKRKEILTHATAWLNLEDPLLNEIRKIQTANTIPFHSYEMPRVSCSETESRAVLLGAEGGGKGS